MAMDVHRLCTSYTHLSLAICTAYAELQSIQTLFSGVECPKGIVHDNNTQCHIGSSLLLSSCKQSSYSSVS